MSAADRPLFPGVLASFTPFDRDVLQRLVRRVRSPGRVFVEVGSWLGTGSTSVFLDALRDGGTLYCVDHWRGAPGVTQRREEADRFDIHATFLANVAAMGGTETVRPLVMESLVAAERFEPASVDLVFLDAGHSYDEIRADIEAWLPKVAPGGILCGHDCEARVADLDRDFLWRHRNQDTVLLGAGPDNVHAGVILAVDEAFGSRAHLWAKELFELPNHGRGASTLWHVER